MNKHVDSPRWLRLAVLTAALVAVLFVATGAGFWHHDAPGTADRCPICNAAHLPALRSASFDAQTAPAAVTRFVTRDLQFTHAAPQALHAPPRAPPV
jgi:hypothetical protein